LSKNATRLSTLAAGYQLYARSEGRSPRTIQIVTSSIASLESFLHSQGVPPNAATIGPAEMRAFILYLQEKRCYSQHPYAPPQTRRLSAHTVNCYMRSIRAFWSWLLREGIVDQSLFDVVKVPKAPLKLMPTFSNSQIRAFLDAIDTRTPEGFRDYAIIRTLLDTGVRVSELTGLRLRDTRLDEGTLRVLGKGNKERLVPVGRGLKRLLWRYISGLRPQPALVGLDFVFLTVDGRPLTKNRVEAMMKNYLRDVDSQRRRHFQPAARNWPQQPRGSEGLCQPCRVRCEGGSPEVLAGRQPENGGQPPALSSSASGGGVTE